MIMMVDDMLHGSVWGWWLITRIGWLIVVMIPVSSSLAATGRGADPRGDLDQLQPVDLRAATAPVGNCRPTDSTQLQLDRAGAKLPSLWHHQKELSVDAKMYFICQTMLICRTKACDKCHHDAVPKNPSCSDNTSLTGNSTSKWLIDAHGIAHPKIQSNLHSSVFFRIFCGASSNNRHRDSPSDDLGKPACSEW